MDSTEARKMPQDVLEEWIRAVNKRKKACKGATRHIRSSKLLKNGRSYSIWRAGLP